MDRIVAVIPVRMASSRFPGKPLARLEIRNTAEAFGAKVIMTSTAHERATDRVAEAVEHMIQALRNFKHIRRVYKIGRARLIGRLLGVRRPGAALVSIKRDR